MHKITSCLLVIISLFFSPHGRANIDLVSLPGRDNTELTIYNSADLTLVREQRTLTLRKGINRLEFGWENTLIDPTSVQLRAPSNEGKVRLQEVIYQKNIRGSALWLIESDIEGPVPVEITFFTSGLNWHAYYMGTLSSDEKTMQLQGYVRVNNYSGEDYQNASTRVIVGNIHLLDEIATLARREAPYNQPGNGKLMPMTRTDDEFKARAYSEMADIAAEMAPMGQAVAKQIFKRGLSEYFLYSIEGTEDILNGWGKRLPSFKVDRIPVRNLYRYEEERYGKIARRLIIFSNDKDHQLGMEPLPNGNVQIFKSLKKKLHLAYVGNMMTKYIPINQDIELDVGHSREVIIEPVLMSETTENYLFDRKGNISGFDSIQDWEIKIGNNRDLPITVEIIRNFKNAYWKIQNSKDNPAKYNKTDFNTVAYTLDLPPRSSSVITYKLVQFEGERQHTR